MTTHDDHSDWSFPAHLHYKFENDPVHDPNPSRRYSPEWVAKWNADIKRDKAFIRLLRWMRGITPPAD